jgi:serine/threonine protein kinase
MENNLKKLDDKYVIEEEISQTKNSKIYFGYSINNPSEKIVIKIFKSTNFIKNNFENLLFEMKKLNNKNITLIINGGKGNIKSLHQIIKNNVYYIINEYQSKGDLFPYIIDCDKGFGEEISKILFCQILSGLN